MYWPSVVTLREQSISLSLETSLLSWTTMLKHIGGNYFVGSSSILLTANSCFQLLVVQESSGRMKGTGIWKIPTGVVEEVCSMLKLKSALNTSHISTWSFKLCLSFCPAGWGCIWSCNKGSKRRNRSKYILYTTVKHSTVKVDLKCYIMNQSINASKFSAVHLTVIVSLRLSGFLLVQIDTEFLEVLAFR